MYHGGKRSLEFNLNEPVFVKDYRNVQKPSWIKGIIIQKIGKSTYLTKIPSINNVIWKRHLNQIKKQIHKESAIAENLYDVSQRPDEGPSTVVDLNISPSIESDTPNVSETVLVRPKRQVKPVDRLVYS